MTKHIQNGMPHPPGDMKSHPCPYPSVLYFRRISRIGTLDSVSVKGILEPGIMSFDRFSLII
uniref:Uncharacterized protein n=1 Tax=Lepeophtheirus salmonis TaxID=72036 RepID=A0A0K2TLN8_LEPSM